MFFCGYESFRYENIEKFFVLVKGVLLKIVKKQALLGKFRRNWQG
jgi:hypothetical protein